MDYLLSHMTNKWGSVGVLDPNNTVMEAVLQFISLIRGSNQVLWDYRTVSLTLCQGYYYHMMKVF